MAPPPRKKTFIPKDVIINSLCHIRRRSSHAPCITSESPHYSTKEFGDVSKICHVPHFRLFPSCLFGDRNGVGHLCAIEVNKECRERLNCGRFRWKGEAWARGELYDEFSGGGCNGSGGW